MFVPATGSFSKPTMYRLFLLFLVFFLFKRELHAQFIFQNLKREDGLSEKQIRCLYKDSEGFLWIGSTNGLNRYDGAVIRQYQDIHTTGVEKLYINAIQPVRDQNFLLIGTKTGLRIFNKTTGTFMRDPRFALVDKEPIEVIKTDHLNRFWIVTGSKIFIFDKGRLYPAGSLIPALRIVQNPQFYFAGFVWDRLRKGFWVGGEKTYFINCVTNEVYTSEFNPKEYPFLHSRGVEAAVLDKDFNLWYGTNRDLTLHFWNRRNNTVEHYYELEGKRVNEGYNFLFIDQTNRLWISTWSFAAYIKEPGKEITKIPYSQVQNYSIAYGHFRDAIQDKEGNIWLGTINGVSKNQENSPIREIFQLPSFDFYLETGFAQSNSIEIDGGQIMAAKEEGVVAYDMTKRTYQRYVVTTDGDLIRNRFTDAAKVGNIWWFAGADGVYFLDETKDKLVRFELINRKSVFKSANFILGDHKGNVWFQVWNDALYRFNPNTGHCDRFDGKDAKWGTFAYRRIQSAIMLRNHDVLFAMSGAGFLKFDAQSGRFSVLHVQNSGNFLVQGLCEDNQNAIWACAFDRGLLKFDHKGRLLDSMTTQNGLVLDQITSIGIDKAGMIWAASREGLAYINPATRKETRVEVNLGKTLQDYWNFLQIYNGQVYAVMLDHILVIDPARFEALSVSKPPNITSIKAFQNEIVNYPHQAELTLRADEDNITFQYASLNHRDIPSLQYNYQLEGVDNNWVNAGRSLSASYNKLSHGHYLFRVRSTDEHGKWMKQVTTVRIYVEPFWWQTWWALLLYAIFIVLSLLAFYKNYQRRRQKKIVDETIDYFANSVYGENSVGEICWDIARNCISQLHFEDCVVYLLDKERNLLIQRATYGPKNPKGHEISNPIEIEPGKGIVGTVAVTGKPLIIHDTSSDPRYIVDDEVRLSELAVPILHEGKVIGVIDSEHRKRGFFKEEHLKALSTIASISSNKIAEALAEAQAQEKEMKLLEINKMLAESQLMALRAQMNPHFVFNCLNSIQECIVTEKYAEASKYLIKFSKLFRMVLNNSGRNVVTIEEERDVLELYLQLEQMRFERSFTYQILIDQDLEPDETLVPSMLVQPYVENALWHGLMHSENDRHVSIEFRRISEDLLECRIEDNGIGRKRSFELKQLNSKTKRHESKGLLISRERLQVLQRQGQHADVQMIDKNSEIHGTSGTLVVIELSTNLRNN
jgi:ligand-binding sensor domain-containing protein/putative methionine-R-sulfoxide reductase with GAF domain